MMARPPINPLPNLSAFPSRAPRHTSGATVSHVIPNHDDIVHHGNTSRNRHNWREPWHGRVNRGRHRGTQRKKDPDPPGWRFNRRVVLRLVLFLLFFFLFSIILCEPSSTSKRSSRHLSRMVCSMAGIREDAAGEPMGWFGSIFGGVCFGGSGGGAILGRTRSVMP